MRKLIGSGPWIAGKSPVLNPRVKKEVSAVETESGVKEESTRPRKKARKEASVEASKVPYAGFSKSDASTSIGGMTKEQTEKSFKDIADVMRDGFGMCVKEIKLLGDRMEAVEKKVGITKKGLHLMIFKSQLQVRQNVCTNPELAPKPLPKSQRRDSLGKVLGIRTDKLFSCVCLDEPLYVKTCVLCFLVCLDLCLCMDFV